MVGVVNDQHDVRLPPESVDLVFISDTYHHFEYPQSTLRSIHRALRPDGELVVIDFKRVPGISNPWVMSHVRAGEAKVIAEITAAGFALSERLDFMQTQFICASAGSEDDTAAPKTDVYGHRRGANECERAFLESYSQIFN